ncbi:hypothetical protein LJB42_002199 [Komagataella kurtzmanii]|nr:hypothetical protein LJB42_002199 [Komagataella kurtzmanii]
MNRNISLRLKSCTSVRFASYNASSKSFQKRKQLETPTADIPYKIGSYASLKLPEEEKVSGLHRLVGQIDSFAQLKLVPPVRDALIKQIKQSTVLRSQNFISSTKKVKTEDEMNGLIIRPTPIQVETIKVVNSIRRTNKNELKVFTLAAETGSGKTWAYLAPLFHKLKIEELESGTRMEKSQIRSVVLVPTHELVYQVSEVVESVCKDLDLSAYRWDVDSNFKDFIGAYRNKIDVLVTTPAKLMSLEKYDDVGSLKSFLTGLNFCVVDEADTLMDKSWINDTHAVLKTMRSLKDVLFVSATIPSEFNKVTKKFFPDSIPITTPSLHRLPKAIEFRNINASVPPYKGSKIKALAQALYAIHSDGTELGYEKRVIVFCNEKKECMKISHRLETEFGHDVSCISSEDAVDVRRSKILPFLRHPQLLEEGQKQTMKVLVCTDLLARGLNFSGIRNVILYDVPKTSVDLVHRAGRTGRMNQGGRVFMIVTNKDNSHVKGLPTVVRYKRRLA